MDFGGGHESRVVSVGHGEVAELGKHFDAAFSSAEANANSRAAEAEQRFTQFARACRRWAVACGIAIGAILGLLLWLAVR